MMETFEGSVSTRLFDSFVSACILPELSNFIDLFRSKIIHIIFLALFLTNKVNENF